MNGTCHYCENLAGCHLLADELGRFIPENVITPENFRVCDGFEEVKSREKKGVRDRLYLKTGLGYMRGLHELPSMSMNGLRQGEKDELMYEEIPDFQDPSLLYEGMTNSAREEVLRFETDENGSVIVQKDDEGSAFKLARPTYHLKHYATDEKSPIGLSKSATWFWSTNQLIEHIIRTEVDLGLIIREKKTRKAKANPKPKLPPAETQEGETQNMPTTGNRTRVTRVTRTPGKAATGKATTAGPQAKTAGKRVTPKKPGAGGGGGPSPGRVARGPVTKGRTDSLEDSGNGSASGNGVDTDVIEQAIARVVVPLFDELKAELQETRAAIASVGGKNTDNITALHDILVQTRGTLQFQSTDDKGNELYYGKDDQEVQDGLVEEGAAVMESCPVLFRHPDQIQAYSLETAYDDIVEEGEGEGAGE